MVEIGLRATDAAEDDAKEAYDEDDWRLKLPL